MNKKIKQAWLAALRSGEYEQGQGRLRVAGESGELQYCCLGVLCELHCKAGLGEWKEEVLVTSYHGAYEFLPFDVRAWAELDSDSPTADGRSLVGWNDGDAGADQRSFTEIAALIEVHL